MIPKRELSGDGARRTSRAGSIRLRYRETIARPMAWRGIFAILFGLFAVSGALGAPSALALVFGLYAAFEALAALMTGLGLKNRSLVVLAVVDSLTGAFFLLNPDLPLFTFSHVVGAWAMLTGVLELFAAGALRRSRKTERAQAAAGVVSVALGFVLGIYPELGPADLAGWLGAAMMLFGCLCILAAARVRFGPASVVSRGKWSDRGAA
jgi:drug/metabolite transporter (DMT)-like permease